MTDATGEPVLILRDGDGNLYVLTATMLEAARVPAERQAVVLAALDTGDDTVGHEFDGGGLPSSPIIRDHRTNPGGWSPANRRTTPYFTGSGWQSGVQVTVGRLRD